jgi:curli biogenesis system outer membrane secretion channel CsgG
LAALLAGCTALAPAQTKKAMEVEDFDYSTVMTATQAIFGTQQNIGTGIQAMLVKRVAQDGKYTVVERRKVANIIKEQDFSASNRVKQGTGARGADPWRKSHLDGRHRSVWPR